MCIKLKDLKAKFGFKPMYDRRPLTISSEDMDPTTFNSLRQAASSTGIRCSYICKEQGKKFC